MASYEVAAVVAVLQDRKVVACQTYEEAFKLADEIFGATDKRTLEYKAKARELSRSLPSDADKDKYLASDTDKSIKITKESVLATTYVTLKETRLKLILVDYIKDKTMKIYGMRKDGTFVKSMCLPYTVFKDHFESDVKTITAQDVQNEEAIEWVIRHIDLSEDNRLLFTAKRKYCTPIPVSYTHLTLPTSDLV
eukprot:TRINITY_DN6511_c0_g2_i5.p1 TRINITY_DN6511_c0_g2~~TRINITY_DN6511_c0_g2_i5.p1  ORF type:complete len:194 (-),score=50.73 TRINITY_DN6511_c0_g2_i5:34-615(-)